MLVNPAAGTHALTDVPMVILGAVMLLRARALPATPALTWWRTLWLSVTLGHGAAVGHHVGLMLGGPVLVPAVLGVVFTLCYGGILLATWRLAALLTAERTPPGLAWLSVLHPALVCALILATSWRPDLLPVASLSAVIHWEAGVLGLPAGAFLIAQAFRAEAQLGLLPRLVLASFGQAVVLGWAAWFTATSIGPFDSIALYHGAALVSLAAAAVGLEARWRHPPRQVGGAAESLAAGAGGLAPRAETAGSLPA